MILSAVVGFLVGALVLGAVVALVIGMYAR